MCHSNYQGYYWTVTELISMKSTCWRNLAHAATKARGRSGWSPQPRAGMGGIFRITGTGTGTKTIGTPRPGPRPGHAHPCCTGTRMYTRHCFACSLFLSFTDVFLQMRLIYASAGFSLMVLNQFCLWCGIVGTTAAEYVCIVNIPAARFFVIAVYPHVHGNSVGPMLLRPFL